MSNYTLSLELDGFDKAEAKLDSFLAKIAKLEGPKLSFNDWLSAGSGEAESAGEKIGDGLKKGIKKNLIGNWAGLVGEFGTVVSKAAKDSLKQSGSFWSDAVKLGKIGLPEDKTKKYGMADLAKSFNPATAGTPDWMTPGFFKKQIMGPKFQNYGMADLSKNFKPQSPQTPEWMTPDFFKKKAPKLQMKDLLVGGIATLFNPFVGARMLSDTIGKSSAGGKTEKGIFGAAGAMGYGEIFIAVKTLELSFKLLTKAVMNTLAAYETARKLYAKSLMQGLGLNFAAKRGMLADVLGVGETDVLRFGAAMNYLNPKLAFAADTLAKTAIPLTGVGWEFKILEENLKALWATVAEGVAPSIGALVENLNSFLVALGKSDVFEGLAMVANIAIKEMTNAIGVFEILVSGVTLGLKEIASRFVLMIVDINNAIANTKVGKLIGLTGKDDSAVRKDLSNAEKGFTDLVGTVIKNWSGKSSANVPPPVAQMKQLQASAWEKMGLVTMGGSNNYQKDIAKNTREMAVGIKMIVSNIHKSSGKSPDFGFSQLTAQP